MPNSPIEELLAKSRELEAAAIHICTDEDEAYVAHLRGVAETKDRIIEVLVGAVAEGKKFQGHHYAPLRALGEECADVLIAINELAKEALGNK